MRQLQVKKTKCLHDETTAGKETKCLHDETTAGKETKCLHDQTNASKKLNAYTMRQLQLKNQMLTRYYNCK